MHGAKDVSCVMSIVVNCNSITQHVPQVTGNSRELQAIPGSYRPISPKQNPKQMDFSEPNPSERDSRELQAIFGSYRPFSGVTARFRELQIPDLVRTPFSRFGSDCFGLLRDLLRIASGIFRGTAVLFGMIHKGLFSFVGTYGSQKKIRATCDRRGSDVNVLYLRQMLYRKSARDKD